MCDPGRAARAVARSGRSRTYRAVGHASIEETEGTYGHLERERHEGRVDLDAVLGGVQLCPPASTVLDAGGQMRDFPRENLVVEGKGFEWAASRNSEILHVA